MEMKEFQLYTENLDKYNAYDVQEMNFMDKEELKKYEYEVEDCSGNLSDWDHCRAIFSYKKIINDLSERIYDLQNLGNKLQSEIELNSIENKKANSELNVSESMNNIYKLISDVETWSRNKGLDKADPKSQFLKVAEEFGEIASGLARNDMSSIEDGIGDTIVTLIILSQQLGLTLEQCLQTAYDEIKGRTGKMVNGVFVKSEDLK